MQVADLQAALEAVNRRWHSAIVSGDIPSVIRDCTPDILVLVRGVPAARGHAQVAALCEQWVRASAGKSEERRETLACGESGDVAYLAAAVSKKVELPGGTSRTATGKLLAVYQREADGTWKARAVSVIDD